MQAVDLLAEGGAKPLLFRILAESVYRSQILLEHQLDAALTAAKPGLLVAVGLLKPSEVEEYTRFRPHTDPSMISRRLETGHLCFVARHQGRLAGVVWVCTGQTLRIEYLACKMTLAPGDAHSYDAWVSPNHRGQSIRASLSAQQVRYLQDAGYSRMFATVLPWNKPALRGLDKAGWKQRGVIGYVKLGSWRRLFSRVTHGSPPILSPTQPVAGSSMPPLA
jgi:GNAT superfamily N-acetyltransferase